MEVNRQLQVPATLTSGKSPPLPIGQVAGWILEPLWMLYMKEKVYFAGNRTLVVQPEARHDIHYAKLIADMTSYANSVL
jgi:hypothetical protein